MPHYYKNLTGQRFGNLVALEPTDKRVGSRIVWKCQCDCGNTAYADIDALCKGDTKGCGCLRTIENKLLGKRFGRLLVIKRTERKSNDGCYYYICECVCSKKTEILGTSIIKGRSRSCGCLRNEAVSLPQGEANFREILRSYKRGAKNRSYEFNLSEDQFRDIIGRNCFYCGIPPMQVTSFKNSNGPYTYNGIDRVNNSKGYTLDNCVACCKKCNVNDKKGVKINTMIKALEFLGYEVDKIPESMI